MVIYFPGRVRRATEVADCPKSRNRILVHAGELGRAPTAVAGANATAHPGPTEGGVRGTPGPAVKASGQARARGLVTTRRVLVAGVAGVMLLPASAQAGAASNPVSNPRIVAHLDFSRGQTPENVALEPDGSADVTLAVAASFSGARDKFGAVRSAASVADNDLRLDQRNSL